MYRDKKRNLLPWLLAILAAELLVVGLWWYSSLISAQSIRTEGATALQAAVQRSALQCYVVEGVYPPSLTYLEENYGLQINTEDFYVTYDIFASNLPPDVRVISKNG